MALRAALDPAPLPEIVHAYFHDTDLLSASRRLALVVALRVLARRRRPTDLERLADRVSAEAPELLFGPAESVPRGGARHEAE